MLENIHVGFSAFGYYGYPLEVIARRGHEAADALRAMGIEVTETDPMTSFDDVPRGLEQLAGKEYDAVIACVIAWTETPVIVGRVRDFCQAAKAVNSLAHARIGMMGYADMGLCSLMFDGLEVRKILGIEVEIGRASC